MPDRHEIETIVSVLRERGPLGRRAIRQELSARSVDARRLARTLQEARREGKIRRVGLRGYTAGDDEGRPAS